MEDEEEEEEAGEGVGGGGEVWTDDETLSEGLPRLAMLWILEEEQVPSARGIWLGRRCSAAALLIPPDKLIPSPPA